MTKRTSEAQWNGTLKEGSGTMKLGSGAFEGPYTYASRFENGEGTNPEELIGATHAGCFSMFLASVLTNNDFPPNSVHTTATVHLESGPTITKIELETEANVPNIDESAFLEFVDNAKKNCPVSKALAGPEITVNATLLS